MKKIFTLAATLFAAICMNASDITIALTSMTAGENSYAYDGAEIKTKNNNVYIELPGANVQGSITIKGSSNKSDRFIYIYGEGGTVKDESRAIQMKSDGETIAFTASDIVVVSEVPYLLFSTTDDFKFKKFNYTYEEGKAIVSTEETLTGVSANGVAMSADQFSNLLLHHNAGFPNEEFAEAPTFVFTKHIVITYEDSSTKESDADIEVVGSEDAQGDWAASATIGGVEYSVYAGKAVAVTITYMDGESVLGTEIVKVGESATKHGEYEVKPLAEFQGWYTDAELTSEADLSATVNADMVLYGKFVKAYATSLNIEQYILDNGRNNADQDHIGEAFAAVLSGAGYAYSNLNALDTLNDLENKENRNYAFLGLKMKTAGASIQFNLQAGKTLAVKFGNLPKPIAVTIDGVAQANHTEGAFLLEAAEADRLIELKTTDKSTVVLQQIMIGEAIADVTLPDPGAYAITLSAENGTLEAAWEGKTEKKVNVPVGETVTLTVTPAEGYKLETITVNEVALEAVEGVYSFTMPAQAANVVATFVAESATGINNTEEAVKAVKVIRNGQLFIEKNGVLFNAQGAVVK